MQNRCNHLIEDLYIVGYSPLVSPYYLKIQMPLTERARETVLNSRQTIRSVIKEDERQLLVVGPCSIHDPKAAKDYASRLSDLRGRVKDRFVVVMRTYFEKPRTSVGWKGLIYEPYLDKQERINDGLSISRELLLSIAEKGLPTAIEFLDTFTPQYIGDLISWGTIGARTVESQIHRQLASGLSAPIGFKNSTHGDVEVAVNAALSARQSHWFSGLDPYGIPSIVKTQGNPYTHIVLRGSNDATNYDRDSVEKAQGMLSKAGLGNRLMIDCSHGNSNKDYRVQPTVFENVIKQRFDGNRGIMGMMLESNINEGNQKIPKNLNDLKYGVSITDPCIGWKTTEKLIMDGYRTLSKRK